MNALATRRERVLLELEDHFTGEMARAAAATSLLNRELNSLSGRAVQTSRDNDRLGTSLRKAGAEADGAGGSFQKAGNDIDRFSGRLQLLLRTAAILGPAMVPIGAVAVPAVAALTAGLGAAAGAFGVTLLAVQGLGDGLKALDKAQLEPTKENLQALREEMDKIGPSGAEFVRFLDSIEPQLKSLQETARNGMFPGFEQAIETMLTELPMVRRLVFDLADAVGDIGADAARNLTGPGFEAFFEYLRTDAASTLKAFAAATGNVIEGIANLLVAFAPLNRDFTGGLVAATDAFANWSAELSSTNGFQAFIDYLRETGPQVAQFVGQLALAFAAVVEAAAPVGQVILPALTALASIIETIASSDLGTPIFAGVAAMSALRLATLGWSKIAASAVSTVIAGNARAAGSYLAVTTATERATMSASKLAAMESARNRAAAAGAGKLAAGLAGLAIAGTGAADGIGMTNTTSLALMGTMLGPWGAALGGAIGFTMDLTAANDGLEQAIRNADSAIKSMDLNQLNAAIAELDTQLASTNEKFNNFHPFSTDLSDPLETAQNNIKGFMAGLNEMITGTGKAAEAKDKEAVAAREAAAANARWAEHARIAGVNAGYSASEIRGMTDAMEENRNEALQAFDAVTRYAQALADARKHAKDAAGGIDASTKAGRENRDVLSNLAGAWNNQSKAVTNNVEKWREARASFIATATAMGVPIQKARELANRLLEIPKQRVIDIEMRGGDESIAAMKRIKAQAQDVAGEYRISFIVTQTNAFNKRAAMGAAGVSADGSTVPKDGGPYADRYPYLLAPGEEVISNRRGQADRHRPLLKAINAGLLADGGTAGIPGLMLGGTAGIGPSSQLFGIDQAFLSIRELAERIGNLSRVQLRDLGRDIDQLGKRDLTKLSKALDMATQAAEENVSAAKEHRDAVLADMKSLKESIANRFRSDVFGQQGDFRLQRPEDWASMSADQQRAFLEAQQSLGRSGGSPVDILRNDIQQAREARQLYRQLRAAGLRGNALMYAQQNASNEELAALLGDPQMLRQYQRLYGVRQEVSAGAGQTAAMQRYGRAQEQAVAELREARSELKAANSLSRETNQRLDRLEKLAKRNPDDTGDAVADALDKGASRATRKGGRP